MIQTPRSQQSQSDLGFYLVLAALWVVPGLIFALAAMLAGGPPHTHIIDWPYVAIRSLMQGHGRVLPWQWVGAREVRSSIVFYAVVVFVTVPLLFGIVVATVVLRGGIPAFFPYLGQATYRSRWASSRGLGRTGLLTSGPDGRRLVLGRHLDSWVALREGISVLALGAAGTGKSAGLCIPAIGDWDGAVVAVSDRHDLIESTAGLRQHLGRVDVLDASGRAGASTVTWSAGAVRLSFDEAIALVENVLGSREPGPDEATRQVVTCALYAAANRGVNVMGAVEWLDDVSGETLVRALLPVPDRDPRATSWARGMVERGLDERAASLSAARQLLRAHFEQAGPGAGLPAFQPTEFLAGADNTLYVLTPDAAPHVSSMVESLLDTVATEAEHRPRRRPLLLVLDGCAAVASMRGLGERLAEHSESVVVLATTGSLEECGAQSSRSLTGLPEQAKAVLLLGGGGDASPADLMHRLVRRQLAPRRPGRGARARLDELRPDLLPPDSARHLGQGRALLVHERMAPAVLWLRNCYEDPELLLRQQEHPFVRNVTRIEQAS